MLNQNQPQLDLYADFYDKIIPKDNLLRRIKELVDFSFIYEELESKYCLINGRNAESPIKLFKYLLLKCIAVLSDVDVVEQSRYDMSFKYFLDLAPTDDVIDPSTLTKFRKLRLKDENLLDTLISKTMEIANEKGLIKSKTIIVDATHTFARYNSKPIREVLLEQSKNLRKSVYQADESMSEKMPEKNKEDSIEKETEYCKKLIEIIKMEKQIAERPDVKKKLNLLEETVNDTEERLYCSEDKDAKTGYKTSDDPFFGYKSHIAINSERLITAATITSGEAADCKELKILVEKSRKNGQSVEDVLADGAYASKDNLDFAAEKDETGTINFKLISKLNPKIINGNRIQNSDFIYNKDADMVQCKAGELSKRKAVSTNPDPNGNTRILFYFDVKKCKQCPFREGCYKGGKFKIYTMRIKDGIRAEHEEFMKTEEFKTKSKERYKIEAKNSELKNVHGYRKAVSAGISNMELQAALTMFAVNLKRIFKLMDENKEK